MTASYEYTILVSCVWLNTSQSRCRKRRPHTIEHKNKNKNKEKMKSTTKTRQPASGHHGYMRFVHLIILALVAAISGVMFLSLSMVSPQ